MILGLLVLLAVAVLLCVIVELMHPESFSEDSSTTSKPPEPIFVVVPLKIMEFDCDCGKVLKLNDPVVVVNGSPMCPGCAFKVARSL